MRRACAQVGQRRGWEGAGAARGAWRFSAVPKSTSSRLGTGGKDTSMRCTPAACAAATAASICASIWPVPEMTRSVSPSLPM